MTDETRDARWRQDPVTIPQGRERAGLPPDTDQPSDAGFDDYDLDPCDEPWLVLGADPAWIPPPLDGRGPMGADKPH